MTDPTLLFIGAGPVQIPAIEYARSRGYFVVACDQNSESAAASHADAFHPVSTTDLDGVLELAQRYAIDGVMTYATDPSALAVAYVGNHLGLPSNPLVGVETLTRKDLFRRFLAENGYFCPEWRVYKDWRDAAEEVSEFGGDVIVKPCDSSGSKGITALTRERQTPGSIKQAFDAAHAYSRTKSVVVEKFVERQAYQIAGDGFMVDGRLVFRCFANEHFNTALNGLVPVGESFPSAFSRDAQDRAHAVLEDMLVKLGMRLGAFNFDLMVTAEGGIFVIEIGPRNGGNLIPEVIKISTGVDLIEYTVNAALGIDCSDLKLLDTVGFYASYIVHALRDGRFARVSVDRSVGENIVAQHLYAKPGDKVAAYLGANQALGAMILEFESMADMLGKMDNMERYIVAEVT